MMNNSLAVRVKRKLKKIAKRALGISNNLLGEKRIFVQNNTPIVKISELCELLEVSVPNHLKGQKHKLLDTTVLFDQVTSKIEQFNGKELDVLTFREEEIVSREFYRKVNVRSELFKDRYYESKRFDHNDQQLLEMAVEWFYLYLPLGFVATDYFDFKLYEKSLEEAVKFVDFIYKQRIKDIGTKPGYEGFCESKPLFNQRLKKFIKRDFVDVRKATFEEFSNFVKKHPTFFAKPIAGKSGKGAGVVSFMGNAEALYKTYKEDKMLMEELLIQHPDIAKFNNDAINTLRVMTLLPLDGKPIVTFAGIRFGRKGMEVDNISGGGMTTSIDINTGKIMTKAIDKHDSEFIYHPDSNLKFEGFQIPNWNAVIEAAKKAAIKLPEIRSVGWDFALLEDGTPELIEGNRSPNFRIAQISDQVGKKYLYENHIDAIEKELHGEISADNKLGKRPFINDKEVFTVNEICKILGVDVPKAYKKLGNMYVYETPLFDRVTNKPGLLETKVKKDKEAYSGDKEISLAFKRSYEQTPQLQQEDAGLIMHYLHWWYLFAPLGIDAEQYFKRKLYEKAEHKWEFKIGNILRVDKNRVFTVKELCTMLKIEVPAKYFLDQNQWIIEMPIFQTLEGYSEMDENIKVRAELKESYYENLKKQAKRFMNKYENSVLMDHRNHEEVLENFVKYLYLFLPLGFWACEYFDFKLYKKSQAQAKTFVEWSYKNKIIRVCNKGAWEYCQDKAIFNEIAKKYVNRDYLDSRICSFDDFAHFISKHPKFFVKPFGANQGKGTAVLEYSDNVRELFEHCKKSEMMIEELVKQHAEIAKINDSTVNTIRIMTLLLLNNEPIVTYAGIRVGRKGRIVDNLSAGGMTAAIDLETGKIFTNAMDKYDNEFTHHPDSDVEFKGFQIPHWDKVIQAVKESAILFPKVRNIGWDVTVTSEGNVEFIEGNERPNFRVVQIADQIGKKPLYEKYIDEIEQWRKTEENS